MLLKIANLYHELMNVYGDSGNLLTLKHRAKMRNIKTEVIEFSLKSSPQLLEKADLFMMGGAQDQQQELVAKNLLGKKAKILNQQIKKGVPGLFICGGFQLLGDYYQTKAHKLTGLSISNHYTESKSRDKRLSGEIVTRITHPQLTKHPLFRKKNNLWLIGFENHQGRTFLTAPPTALAKVESGYGNNGQDQTEGVVIHHAIGTYLHGPILPRNPAFADYLIEKALEIKYNRTVRLDPLEDILEQQNRIYLLTKLKVNVKEN